MIDVSVAGFDWDEGNREKCQQHGVPIDEIEGVFGRAVVILPDVTHSQDEERFRAVGQTAAGRHVFIVFTLRTHDDEFYIRPISARYMHRKEVESYEEDNSDL